MIFDKLLFDTEKIFFMLRVLQTESDLFHFQIHVFVHFLDVRHLDQHSLSKSTSWRWRKGLFLCFYFFSFQRGLIPK